MTEHFERDLVRHTNVVDFVDAHVTLAEFEKLWSEGSEYSFRCELARENDFVVLVPFVPYEGSDRRRVAGAVIRAASDGTATIRLLVNYLEGAT